MILPFVICFIPSFLENLSFYEEISRGLLGKVFGLLPDRLLQMNNIITNLDVYSVGKLVFGAVPVLFVLYLVLTAALVPAVYRQFRREGIR